MIKIIYIIKKESEVKYTKDSYSIWNLIERVFT